MSQVKILITGAGGQIGSELKQALRLKHGHDNVIATDIAKIEGDSNFHMLDILNTQRMKELVQDLGVTQIYHLAAILSASGEWNPMKTWNVNLNALLSVLELARHQKLEKVFFPSTIGAFGPFTPKDNTPQYTDLTPDTVYGISKVTAELWGNYYFKKYNLDVRSMRYPGIISWKTIPHGGTTDYAVEIFHSALKNETYTCFLSENSRLPMMYIPDAIRATLELMHTDAKNISVRTSYNIAAMSFTPAEIFTEIKKIIPTFNIEYKPDFREQIAESWPSSIDDQMARSDWNWNHEYNLESMVKDVLNNLSKK